MDGPKAMRPNLLFLRFDRSPLLSFGFRQTLFRLSLTFVKFLEDTMTDSEVLPFRFVEDIEWLEINNLSRRWVSRKRTKDWT